MNFDALWSKLQKAPTFVPSIFPIPNSNTDKSEQLATPFEPNENYFTIRVNEMFLSYERKWFSTYDPVVLSVTQFNYDGEKKTVPFVVGPGLLSNLPASVKVPEGMIYRNTTVAGTHPFKGGTVCTSIILCRMRQENYLRKILKIIEQTAGTYMGGFATMLNPYMKVANIVLDGIDQLFDSGDIHPLIGYRNEISRNASDNFLPGYYVMINIEEHKIDAKKFFVKDNILLYGDSLATAKPFRAGDYVLYSIMSQSMRDDIEVLPVFKQWEELRGYTTDLPEVNDEDWKQIKARLFSLHNSLWKSPDLTNKQASVLAEEYKQIILQLKAAKAFMGADKIERKPIALIDREALDILNLK
ncbi:hypothetical protein DVR12_23455 [Chitinophaga silvatica]|uniref:Uncharacterized protein n=1 Tax=Chitinophaga silvatica TaxID=2282649 RepID=A0A3E1Y4J0_9BACT|nr:hypothetical protein [Chitinophaga silvatica]RFS19589.1 hypothetical protein DVR12_23455 [Chitinophaga silvatica]